EAYFNGASASARANIKSASKSILSALVGIAIAEGHFTGLDQPVAPLFPEYASANPDPRIRAVTIGNLLPMQAGLEAAAFGIHVAWVPSSNWVRNALPRSHVDDPGGRMLCSTASSHILSAALTRAPGLDALTFARSRLLDPLGIDLRGWTTDP